MKMYNLNFGLDYIDVTVEDNGIGVVSSNLKSMLCSSYNFAIHGIESLILAHACAGIDVSESKYKDAIFTALEAVSNNLL